MNPTDQPWFKRVLADSQESLLRKYAFNRGELNESATARRLVKDEDLDTFEQILVEQWLLDHEKSLDD